MTNQALSLARETRVQRWDEAIFNIACMAGVRLDVALDPQLRKNREEKQKLRRQCRRSV
jgi:hypothetical protein